MVQEESRRPPMRIRVRTIKIEMQPPRFWRVPIRRSRMDWAKALVTVLQTARGDLWSRLNRMQADFQSAAGYQPALQFVPDDLSVDDGGYGAASKRSAIERGVAALGGGLVYVVGPGVLC